ncbi:MAG: CCA tRNA nucleotidyltransferase [Planctomycetota bacterium]|nr:MAG: CCA tRNA nucleotidyltransferase [Planctomycetota bacterium]
MAQNAPEWTSEHARGTAASIVRRLREAGHVAYFAGGCVRDELLGLDPVDYDVATDARPDAIQAMFRKTAAVGASFGVVLVKEAGGVVEVATFRSDGPYTDNRRPDRVEFADAAHDAERRDFTINALFLDPLAAEDSASIHGHVIDHVGGMADLRARVIRAVGDPERRLAEDHLRALRAVRFAARFGFAIEQGTASAIREHASDLEGVSRERVGDELRRMFLAETRAEAAGLLDELSLDGVVLGVVPTAARGSALAGLAPGEFLGEPVAVSFPAALAALAFDRGRPSRWPRCRGSCGGGVGGCV